MKAIPNCPMASGDIVGSWFPSGYYGHFRSKSRNDFIGEYRQLAKPQPPKKFINRSKILQSSIDKTYLGECPEKQPTPRHVFSHHDNRESFLNDALYFEQGLGRKRVPNQTYAFKNDFIAWMPEREYIERTRPLVSTYRVDFKDSKEPVKNVPQIIVKRPKTSFEGVPTTSYRYAHGESSPNKEVINVMNNEALKLSLMNRKDRAMSAKTSGRESVASCLVWYNPDGEKMKKAPVNRSTVPAATQTTFHAPHPPASQKTCPSSTVTTQYNNGYHQQQQQSIAQSQELKTAPAPTATSVSQPCSQQNPVVESLPVQSSNQQTLPPQPAAPCQTPAVTCQPPATQVSISWAPPQREAVCG